MAVEELVWMRFDNGGARRFDMEMKGFKLVFILVLVREEFSYTGMF